ELVHSPSVEDMRSNIASLYGILLAKELLEVQYDEQGIKVHGFISSPYRTRGDKSLQELFVNGRWVRNEDIMNAVYEGYHAALFVGTHPVVFLRVDVDPHTIDVNVHPTKAEIKIEQKEKVCEAVSRAVRQALEENNVIPQVNPVMEQQATLGTGMSSALESSAAKESYYSFEPSAQTVFRVAEGAAAMMPSDDFGNGPIEQEETTWKQPVSVFPAFRLLGQVHKTFFVAETLGGVYYIDQHAAHERVLYERFMEQYMKQGVEVQLLLQGEIIQFTAAETAVVEEQREELDQFGFQLEPFGTNTFVLKTIPLLFGRQQRKEVLYDVLEMLKERKQKVGETKEEIITRMACRAAVMAGEELTIVEMEQILRELGETQFPFTCPHGRPTILKVSVEELQKKFKRI
ncbi:MAG: DNA mismatch repair endonuclease MutL, partial [Nanoarchaeota archaeon]